jgi:hypothetical protein
MRFFASGFFHESSFSNPLKIRLGSFQIKIKNSARRYSRYTTGINNTDGKFAVGVNYTGFADQRNLQIWVLQINENTYAYIKLANLHISEICGFTIANLAQEFADL